jgi:hypothetical protein
MVLQARGLGGLNWIQVLQGCRAKSNGLRKPKSRCSQAEISSGGSGKLIQVVGRTQFLSIVGSRACFLLSSVGGSSQFILSADYDNLQIVTMQPGKLNKGG